MADEQPKDDEQPAPEVQPLPLQDDEVERLGGDDPREELKALERGQRLRIGRDYHGP